MAAFLTSLGSATGMTGAGGIAGGLGNIVGQSIMGQSQPMGAAQAPNSYIAAPQAGYTPVAMGSAVPQTGQSYDPYGGMPQQAMQGNGWQNNPMNQYMLRGYSQG